MTGWWTADEPLNGVESNVNSTTFDSKHLVSSQPIIITSLTELQAHCKLKPANTSPMMMDLGGIRKKTSSWRLYHKVGMPESFRIQGEWWTFRFLYAARVFINVFEVNLKRKRLPHEQKLCIFRCPVVEQGLLSYVRQSLKKTKQK